jgi:glycosyltransferase involved in cell wall biosynthesis
LASVRVFRILRTVTAAESALPTAPDGQLRVLWLIKGLGVGGAEQLLLMSARNRDRGRIHPTVAYLLRVKSDLAGAMRDEDVETRCFDGRSSWNVRWMLALRRLLQTGRFDVIHIHSPLMAVGARLVVKSLPRGDRPRIIVTEHNVWNSHTLLTRFSDRLTTSPREVRLAVSIAVRDSMPPAIRARARVLRHGIDTAKVRAAAPARDAVRESLGVPPGALVVGTVANLRATKGYPDLLLAARTVLDSLEGVHFISVGRGPLEPELRSMHAQLGLGDRFQLLGHRSDAVRVMSAFDVFCLPSHYEGLPVALMEALALGLPVVATRVGGLAELVTDGREAVLVPPRRPEQLADALLAVLRDPTRRAEMSRWALRTAETLNIENTVREVEAVYREVMGS